MVAAKEARSPRAGTLPCARPLPRRLLRPDPGWGLLAKSCPGPLRRVFRVVDVHVVPARVPADGAGEPGLDRHAGAGGARVPAGGVLEPGSPRDRSCSCGPCGCGPPRDRRCPLPRCRSRAPAVDHGREAAAAVGVTHAARAVVVDFVGAGQDREQRPQPGVGHGGQGEDGTAQARGPRSASAFSFMPPMGSITGVPAHPTPRLPRRLVVVYGSTAKICPRADQNDSARLRIST